ncbi:MAG: TetR/AcrR family transcriptional regulator [Gammaproteobacteria bacterium]|nr:TetR/AcrR family transcriptional regulator [Gammaproteobacteria bacterium]
MSKTQHPKKEEKQGARRIPRPQRELQMLEAAAVEFGRKGFEATSMDDIAAACGVTKPMLYNYFGSKDGLYAAMINQAGSHLVKSIIALRDLTDPVQRLHGAMGVFLEFVERYRDSWRMVFSGKGSSGQDQQGSIAGYRQQILIGTLYTLGQLRPAGTSGEAARQHMEPYAWGLLGAGESIAQWWLGTPGIGIEQARAAISKMIDATVVLARAELLAADLPAGKSEGEPKEQSAGT